MYKWEREDKTEGFFFSMVLFNFHPLSFVDCTYEDYLSNSSSSYFWAPSYLIGTRIT